MAKPKEPVVVPEPVVPEPPKAAEGGVSREEFVTFATNLSDTLKSVRGGFDALAADRNARNEPRPTVPTYDEPTDAEWVAANESGDALQVRALMRREAKAIAARSADTMRRDEIAPLRQVGLNAMASMARSMAQTSAQMPHYERYKDEIEGRLAAITKANPEASVDPDNIRLVYSLVVGQHSTELEKEAEERAVRRLRDDPAALARANLRAAPADDRATAPPRDVAELIGGEEGRKAKTALGFSPGGMAKLAAQFGKTVPEYEAMLAKMYGTEVQH